MLIRGIAYPPGLALADGANRHYVNSIVEKYPICASNATRSGSERKSLHNQRSP